MGNFQRPGGGFNRGFGGGKKFGGRDGGRPAMFKATCSECGAGCELPFRPSGERPVFCSNCFAKQNEGGDRPNRFADERRERPHFEDRQMHDAVCAKCGKACQVPFRPMAGKPIFCESCFDRSGRGDKTSKNSDEVMEQIKMLNTKMDKLMAMLAPKTLVEKTEKPEVKKIVKEKKVKAKTKAATKKVTEKTIQSKSARPDISARREK